ncbi:uncharacterized protein LOC120113630 [Hibiscus syriacus]|uniref:uncharacterized protein LOC120113630 n=1 Tax=Hibiscus syriacus TaxID=106335 RepID=UPI001921865D|nr:uncharacterized protein LOC120113630 [Hibiscus syriacus]
MDRNAITASILLFLMISDVASSSFWKLRYLADESPSENDTIAAAASTPSSLLPIPLKGPGDKKLDLKRDNSTKSDPKSSKRMDSMTSLPVDKKDMKPLGKPAKVNSSTQKEIASGNNSILTLTSTPKGDKTIEENEGKKKNVDSGKNSNSTNTQKGSYTKEDKEIKKKKKKPTMKNADENNSNSVIAKPCDGIVTRCEDQSSLTACIKGFGTGSKELTVLVHNSGEEILNVNLDGPYGGSFPKRLRIPKHGSQKINIPTTVDEPSSIVLTAGNGNCILPLDPNVSNTLFFSKLPSYDKLLTPVNGAYFLIVAVAILGGSWGCCIYRKRRQHDHGIPYQELEMGMPESMAATVVETTEGWDQVWDDDWDEDNAVRSPLGRNVTTSISANCRIARSSSRDDWDD